MNIKRTLISAVCVGLLTCVLYAAYTTYLVVALPMGSDNSGWDYAPTRSNAVSMLHDAYAHRHTREKIEAMFTPGYTNNEGVAWMVFCDSDKNILGSRVAWNGYVPTLIAKMQMRISDTTTIWGVTSAPDVFLGTNDLTNISNDQM